MFALVGEEATTLVLAGQHLVDFVDFDIAEVIFFRKVKCRPVEIVLEYFRCLTVRGALIVRQRRAMKSHVPDVKMSGCIS